MKSLIAFAEERNVSIEELDEVDMKSFIRHQNWA
jgi:hypothetical protein